MNFHKRKLSQFKALFLNYSLFLLSVAFSISHTPAFAEESGNLLLYLPAIISHSDQTYSIRQINNNGTVEQRFYCNDRHFMTLVNENGTLNLRPHPGVDINGWGSSWYAQPFLPGAVLQYTTIQTLLAEKGTGIHLVASGKVARGTTSTYGTWAITMDFEYSQRSKKITGSGIYSINLAGALANAGGDLNLYKIASNYLDDVPLLSGNIGDTGDMKWVAVTHSVSNEEFVFSPWVPPVNPAFFPTDATDYLTVDVSGTCNNVDTAAQGYAAIQPAFKPSLKIALVSRNSQMKIQFGGIYDMSKSKDFWQDNVGVTPIIPQNQPVTSFSFDVYFESSALPGDGGSSCP